MELSPLEYFHSRMRPYAKAKTWNKCFCIGDHKTGTSTVDFLMNLLGYDCAPQLEVEMAAAHQVQLGIYHELREIVSRYDFFQDSPFACGMVFVALDALFPNSKFIFTYRDPEEWWASKVGFDAKGFGISPSELSYESISEIISKDVAKDYLRIGFSEANNSYWKTTCVDDGDLTTFNDNSLLYDKSHNIDIYLARRDYILKYFSKRPSDLLVLDLSKEKNIAKVVKFLGMPEWVSFTMPRVNSTNEENDSRVEVELLDPMLKRVLQA